MKLQLLAVRLLLKCNAFQFDENFFTQIEGLRMMNTCKCMLALVNFVLIEKFLIEMKFKAKITLIDYMFINCKKINMQLNSWRDYQTCLKKQSNLYGIFKI